MIPKETANSDDARVNSSNQMYRTSDQLFIQAKNKTY